jgi:flavin reductase (DIM6/NTAB) family NADH-FMN oxidoreductase RutF
MDADVRRRTLRRIPYGLYIVTTSHDGKWNGFTGSWLTQASFEPPLLALGVRRDSGSFRMIARSRVLAVHWLRKGQRDLARRFLKPARWPRDKFADLRCREGVTGVPVIEDALAFAECRVRHVFEGGDHAVVVAEIVDIGGAKDGQALLVSDTRWCYGG